MLTTLVFEYLVKYLPKCNQWWLKRKLVTRANGATNFLGMIVKIDEMKIKTTDFCHANQWNAYHCNSPWLETFFCYKLYIWCSLVWTSCFLLLILSKMFFACFWKNAAFYQIQPTFESERNIRQRFFSCKHTWLLSMTCEKCCGFGLSWKFNLNQKF